MISPIRARPHDDSWRLAGCGDRCRLLVIVQQGRGYPERMVSHDPYHHEAYGEFDLAARADVLAGQIVRTAELVIDGRLLRVTVAGREIRLMEAQRALLFRLAGRAGAIVTRHEILTTAWGAEYSIAGRLPPIQRRNEHDSQMVRMLVHRLRRKLGAAGRLIETETGCAYSLRLEPVVEAQP